MNESTEQILREICQKLGVGVEMIWSAYVKQAPLEPLSYLIMFSGIAILLSVVLLILSKVITLCCDEKKDPFFKRFFNDDNEGVSFAFILVSFFLVITISCAIYCTPNVVTGVFNPEYWAAQKLLHAIR